MFRSFYRLGQESVVRSALLEEFSYKNIHQVPKVEKIIVKQFIPDASQNARAVVATINDLTIITGQKPIKSRTNQAFSNFRNREIQPMGVSVTLKGNMMYSFLDRLINLGLPSTDFQGSFDGHGSYRVRFREQGVFPEISPEAVIGKQRVLDVCITTTAQTQKETHRLLALMGLPFEEALNKAPI